MRILFDLLTFLVFAANSVQPDQRPITREFDLLYGRAGGQELRLDIYRPGRETTCTAAAPRPAILFVHGGGWSGGDRKHFRTHAEWFARRGFVAFSAGYRLARDGRNPWPAQLDDVQLAVRWVRAHAADYCIDPHALGAMGASAGGHLVAMLGTRDTRDTTSAELPAHSSRVACVVDICGPTDLTQPLPTSTPYGNVQAIVDNLFGQPASQVPELARDASPLLFADYNTVPFLMVHGDKDDIVPLAHSIRLHEALQRSGVASTLSALPGEAHGFSPKGNDRLLRESLTFFRKHLKPEPAPGRP